MLGCGECLWEQKIRSFWLSVVVTAISCGDLQVDGEVHRKLKEVLEETLLENIRLKEDVDAMGSEVARLADELETSGGPSEQ